VVEMTLPDVLAFLDLADELGIVPWLAGGWGNDAERGEQTRRHDDLDVFLDARDAATLAQHLALRGFTPWPEAPWHITYTDAHGRSLDVRLFEHDGDQITYGPDERWPASVLSGYGVVGARTVRRTVGMHG
jgi:lincosamide nucleotidyltransferase A/C/D/E